MDDSGISLVSSSVLALRIRTSLMYDDRLMPFSSLNIRLRYDTLNYTCSDMSFKVMRFM